MVRPWLLLAAAAAVALTLLGGAPPARDLEWGIYQIYWGRAFAGNLEREVKKFATAPDYVMFYRDLSRPFPAEPIAAIRTHGATPIVSLELWHWHDRGRRVSRLPALVEGKYDDFFRTWARAAKADGRRVLLRFGFEMNGDWFTWSGDPGRYVAAWRRVRGIFAEERATNVEWVWCPNVVGSPRTPENGMQRYYPGDDHVDWVGLDGYNFGDGHDEWHRWESFESVFAEAVANLAEHHPRKPIMIGETGCAPGERRAAWIREAHRTLAKWPRVRAVVWFHYDKRREQEPDWRIDASPESLEAFNDTFARR